MLGVAAGEIVDVLLCGRLVVGLWLGVDVMFCNDDFFRLL